MYWRVKYGHSNRRITAVVLIMAAIFFLLKDENIFLPSRPSDSRPLNKTAGSTQSERFSNKTRLKEPQNVTDDSKKSHETWRKKIELKKKLKEIERAKERQYYKLRKVKQDHCDFPFLVDGLSICENHVPFLLVLVPSLAQHTNIRQTIRETWGRYASQKTLPPSYSSYVVKIAFLFGKWENNDTKELLLNEKRIFRDIVVGDFNDTYQNLTRKILMGLKWMSTFCGEADYILKVDEDIFVNIPRLVDVLTQNPANMTGSIYGHLYRGGPVARKGKWTVSENEYPMSQYPPYMSGNSYVISGAVAPRLLFTSQRLPYLPIEDAFITGILPRINDISQIHIDGFTSWKEMPPTPCEFVREKRISANKMNANLMRRFWSTFEDLPHACARN